MHPIELSTKVIDSGIVDQPLNRVTNEITELATNLAIVESFSHSVVWDTGDGLMCFDASGSGSGEAVVQSIRTWRTSPISTLVYTHGHADHVGGISHSPTMPLHKVRQRLTLLDTKTS